MCSAGERNKMIVTYSSKLYAKFLDLLIPSCYWTNPTIPIKAYLMGWTENEADEYRLKYPYCHFVRFPLPKDILNDEILNKYTKEILLKRLKNRFIPPMTWYKIFLALHETMNQSILWVDADTLIFQDIQPLFDKFAEYDIFCTYRPTHPDKMRIYSGVMGFASRPHVIKYLARCLTLGWDLVDERAIYHWGEQLAFYRGLELTSDIKLYSLPDNEHSINKNTNAMILSSKNLGSDKDSQYLKMKEIFIQKEQEWTTSPSGLTQ